MATDPLLLDRDHEAELISDALAHAIRGRGRLLVVEGDAGIGKTRLLRHARDLAGENDVAVYSARGSELEQEFAFGIVRQLFEPKLAAADPAARRLLLSGAAAGAGRIFQIGDTEPDGTVEGGQLPILHGLFWLTVNACQRPTVFLIDDLHWSDVASLHYLAYLLPRLAELALLVVAVVRTGERAGDQSLLDGLFVDDAVTVLRPGPLSEPAVHALLRVALDRDIDAEFSASCAAATAGNPLLLRALADRIAGDGLEPTAANQDRVAVLGPAAVSRQVSLRLDRLSDTTRSVARAAAVLGPDAPLAGVAALAQVEMLTAADSADELARRGLLDVHTPPGRPQDPSVRFVHPLVEAAVYGQLSARERALAHARAAEVLAGLAEQPERVAVHLLKTLPGLDAAAVPRLQRAATGALHPGSPEAALAFLRRCLAEDLDPQRRFGLLEQAATIAVQVDLQEAVRLFEQAKTYPGSAATKARIAGQLGIAYGYLVEPDQACAALTEALSVLPEGDSDQRRRLEATLLNAVFVAPGQGALTQRLDELTRLPPRDGIGARMLEAAIASHEMASCDPRGHARARAALSDGLLVRAANGEGPVVCGWLTLLAADDPAGLDSLDDAVRQAHLRGSLRALAPAYAFRALGRLWSGQLGEAEADAREALRLAETGRVDFDSSFAGAYLADALMEQGRLTEAETALRRVGVPDDISPARPRYAAVESYARLVRRQGGTEAAAVAATAGQAWQAYGFQNPAMGSWRSEAALAQFVRGNVDQALTMAHEELDLAARWQAPRGYGRALRVAGQLTGGTDGLDLLHRSVAILDGTSARLEYAKSLAELGAAQRRAGRRLDARHALRQALDVAEICGATPLVRQVTTELHAAGFRPRRRRLAGVNALTPSERRVAEIAAGGASNREIAQTLFVTTKTVEVHLTSAYRKLGVRRRGELARQLG